MSYPRRGTHVCEGQGAAQQKDMVCGIRSVGRVRAGSTAASCLHGFCVFDFKEAGQGGAIVLQFCEQLQRLHARLMRVVSSSCRRASTVDSHLSMVGHGDGIATIRVA